MEKQFTPEIVFQGRKLHYRKLTEIIRLPLNVYPTDVSINEILRECTQQCFMIKQQTLLLREQVCFLIGRT